MSQKKFARDNKPDFTLAFFTWDHSRYWVRLWPLTGPVPGNLGFGLDPSRRACQVARARLPQAKIINGTFEIAQLPERFFDVITMIATIYFLPHPVRDLSRARNLLKHDGIIAVHSPNFANRGYLYRPLKPHLPEAWVYFYNRQTLAKILQRAGLKIIANIDLPGFRLNSDKVLDRIVNRIEFQVTKFFKDISQKMIDLILHFLLVAQPE